jgi:hypothetical protein
MRSLEAKLNGKGPKHRRKSACQPSSSSRRTKEEIESQYILSVFGQIIGARMESCRRVQKLVACNSRSVTNTRYDPRQIPKVKHGFDLLSRRSPDQPGVEDDSEMT